MAIMKESIFVQIPSYRDWELPKTVKDCVSKSSGEYQIHFGIHNCILNKNEIPLDFEDAKVSYAESIAPQNLGLQKSRKIANSFYGGETYYLQIDAHMRFVKNWDTILVSTIKRYQHMGIKKPLVTQYPAIYTYEDNGKEKLWRDSTWAPYAICLCENRQQFKDILLPIQRAVISPPNCGFTYSVSGGFIFTVGNFANIIPNEKIAFWGEEPLIAARAFTHGFDLVVPNAETLFHLYHSNQLFEKVKRILVWEDFPELWQEMDMASKAEYMSIFTERRISDDALGTERTLEEFEEFTGLNFTDRTIKCWLHENHAAP